MPLNHLLNRACADAEISEFQHPKFRELDIIKRAFDEINAIAKNALALFPPPARGGHFATVMGSLNETQ